MDIADYNARWLGAWTAKDVEALCGFYAENVVYKDPQTAADAVKDLINIVRGYESDEETNVCGW